MALNMKEYEAKFGNFIKMCLENPNIVLYVDHAAVLGDTHEELCESLCRLSRARIALQIAEDGQPSATYDRVAG